MHIVFLIGFVAFIAGWSIRSTFVMQGYVNKPVGGIMIAIGALVMGISLYKIIKNGNSIGK